MQAMARVTGVDYDQDAGEYAAHRRLHAGVCTELVTGAGLGAGSRVVEVGCGTGNYARALADGPGCTLLGLDPSSGMLSHAHRQPEPVCWLQARAEELPLAPGSADLVFSVDVIHHVAGPAAFFQAVARALRPGGWVCTVTDSEEIIRQREILSGYFPETVAVELQRYPKLGELRTWSAAAGLVDFRVVTVEQPYTLESTRPFRDRAFSSLHLISEEAWQAGLARLEADLARGPVHGVSRYACVWAARPA
ncbi:MAG: methyltransferase domain-containing protein [Anaerolineae bacterium]|jgi:ubiquinone/menaquinone biosynthesis C-methylase UbiE|nr:methyltransferase domain-containing protein [Anaerolineae bacterium]